MNRIKFMQQRHLFANSRTSERASAHQQHYYNK